MFSSLEEGIILVQNGKTIYSNDIFKEISNIIVREQQQNENEEIDLMDLKMFKLYRNSDVEEENKTIKFKADYATDNSKIFTLKDIIMKK